MSSSSSADLALIHTNFWLVCNQITRFLVPFRLSHVDGLLQVSIQECRLHVELHDMIASASINRMDSCRHTVENRLQGTSQNLTAEDQTESFSARNVAPAFPPRR